MALSDLVALGPDPLTADDERVLRNAFRVSVHPDTGELTFTLITTDDRKVTAALKAIRKIEQFQQPESEKFEPGEFWIWEAHRSNTFDYLQSPGLGLSFDVIADNQDGRNPRSPDPRVPPHLRTYLHGRSRKPEVRKQIVLRAFKKVEKYRQRLEADKNVKGGKGYWFRFVWQIHMDPETIEAYLCSKSPKR